MWKSINGYEGYYEISDSGAVRSLSRYVTENTGKHTGKLRLLKGAEMKLTKSPSGYYVVNLHKNHVSRVAPVHVLVAEAFIPNPGHKETVNHIDGNKENNNASNLEWATYGENNIHALENKLREPRGTAIQQYTMDGKLVACYRSVTEAARVNGFSRGGISHCVNNRTSSSSGYVWRKQSESQTTIPHGSTWEDELPMEAQRPFEERKI